MPLKGLTYFSLFLIVSDLRFSRQWRCLGCGMCRWLQMLRRNVDNHFSHLEDRTSSQTRTPLSTYKWLVPSRVNQMFPFCDSFLWDCPVILINPATSRWLKSHRYGYVLDFWRQIVSIGTECYIPPYNFTNISGESHYAVGLRSCESPRI
jgi:hypothetical protein